jgi:hypothetical protein
MTRPKHGRKCLRAAKPRNVVIGQNEVGPLEECLHEPALGVDDGRIALEAGLANSPNQQQGLRATVFEDQDAQASAGLTLLGVEERQWRSNQLRSDRSLLGIPV